MAEIDDVMSAVKELRNEVEKKSADQEKINKLQSALDASEKKNQELVKKQAELENAQREIAAKQEEIEKLAKASGDNSERIKELEKEIALHAAAPAGAGDAWKNSEEHIAFKEYFLNGIGAKTMRTDTDVQGGYLVHPEFAADILRQLHDVSPIRSFARVRTTSKKDLTIPVRTDIPVAKYVGETEESPESEDKFDSETLTAYRQTVTLPVTLDLLQFSNYNVESEFAADVATAFAIGEGRAFLKGSGHKQPEGILMNSAVERIEGSASGKLVFDDVLALPAELKSGYKNPVYGFNRRTLYALRTAKDQNGQYLWRMGGENMPAVIGDYKYVIFDDMPDVAVNATPVMFGDLFAGYTILDSTQMGMIRDEYTSKKKAIIEMTWHRWNTGQVTMAEAIKLLKIKA